MKIYYWPVLELVLLKSINKEMCEKIQIYILPVRGLVVPSYYFVDFEAF